MNRMLAAASFLAFALLLSAGCGPENFPSMADATLADANRIVGDGDLTPNEKRVELTALNFSPLEINLLLRSERTGNQFGGDLRSAYEKVTGEGLATLTPDEIQIYGDQASDVDDALNVSFNDETALDIQRFFEQNGLNAREDLEAFLDDDANAALIPAETDEAELRGVFVDFDPDRLLDRLP